MALSDTTALIGAWGTDGTGPASGVAYVFERGPSQWRQSAILINPDNGERHVLGQSVAIDENVAVVAAPGANRRKVANGLVPISGWTGNVYIWSKGEAGWQYWAKFSPDLSSQSASTKGTVYNFGAEVAIAGDIIVVSAYQHTASPGQVYIFRRHNNTWAQEAILEMKRDSFASSITISNETIAVASADAIFIYIHFDGDWRLQAMLEPNLSGEETGFKYGGSLSIDNNLLVAGAARYKQRKGAAYVFERVGANWKQVAILTVDDTKSDRLFKGSAGDLFGGSVSIHGNTIVVGASFHDSEGPNNGAAYVFVREGSQWILKDKLVAPKKHNMLCLQPIQFF